MGSYFAALLAVLCLSALLGMLLPSGDAQLSVEPNSTALGGGFAGGGSAESRRAAADSETNRSAFYQLPAAEEEMVQSLMENGVDECVRTVSLVLQIHQNTHTHTHTHTQHGGGLGGTAWEAGN